MLNVKVGDEVVYHGIHGKRRVKVTRVGRILFDVELHGRAYSFRLENGQENGLHVGSPDFVRTLEQEEAEQRLTEAWAVLREAGLSSLGRLDPDLVHKLAQVVREHQGGAR